jgi:hypothetical protein
VKLARGADGTDDAAITAIIRPEKDRDEKRSLVRSQYRPQT